MTENLESTRNRSAWEGSVSLPPAPPLDRHLPVHVCVIGAGIAGVTTAYLLARQGRTVAVIDRGPLVGGETGNTTAHLSNALDDRYRELEKMHGSRGARLAAESHSAAIDKIEQIAREENLRCDFERVDGYLFLGEGQTVDLLKEEVEAAHRAGLDSVEMLDRAPVRGFSSGPCLRFPRQAQFHPLRYLKGLIGRAQALGVRFFADTPATGVTGGAVATVRTRRGYEIRCQAVVVATNSPVNDRYTMHSKLYPYRTYAIGGLVKKGAIDRALYWDALDVYHYVRLQDWRPDQGERVDGDYELLIAGGEDHKTGQCNDAGERFRRLEEWTRSRFPAMEEVRYRWSGQVIETLDGLAHIGRNPLDRENVFIATGDSGMGITHGTIAGILLSDLILEKRNAWEALYDPSRKPLQALPHFAEENLNVGLQYGKWFTPGEVDSVDEILPGSGAVVRAGLVKQAVYRDGEGKIHRRSAVCPHLGCIVSWNSSTSTWDCPCHGSRFDSLGKVVTGPSIRDLDPIA